jgi:hypothetical protein
MAKRRYGAFTVTFALGAALAAVACARPDLEIRALPDGTRELTCKYTLSQCLSHADDVCKGASYEVLYATDTQKVYGSPSSNEIESRTSQAVIHCLGIHDKPKGGQPPVELASPAASAGAPPAPSGAVAVTTTAPVPQAHTCVPGATQSCVGPAACAGGQACLPDGSGFGPCDCGGPKP